MISLHFLPANEAPYTHLIEFDERGHGQLETHFVATVPVTERLLSPVYQHWIVTDAALPSVLQTAREQRSALRYHIPPQPNLFFPYPGWGY